MPLTPFQASVAQLLAANRTPESHLAGGAAIHIDPGSPRISNDLDYFQDSEQLATTKAREDMATLRQHGYLVETRVQTPTFTRAFVSKDGGATKVEWCYESNFRFFPAIKDKAAGYRLHPIDLAINKLNALASREVPRDFIDAIYVNRNHLSVGAMVWASCGRFPGMPPPFFLEQLARQTAVYGPKATEEIRAAIAGLNISGTKMPRDFPSMRAEWNEAMTAARKLIKWLPENTAGCLFIDGDTGRVTTPRDEKHLATLKTLRPHAGGVLPAVGESPLLAKDPAAKRAFKADYGLEG